MWLCLPLIRKSAFVVWGWHSSSIVTPSNPLYPFKLTLKNISARPRPCKYMWKLRALWLVFEFRYTWNVTGSMFVFVCATSASTSFCVHHGVRIWICLWDYFGPRITFSWSFLRKRKMEKRRRKEFLTTWECLRSSLNWRWHTWQVFLHERLAVLQNVFAIILLWASEDVEKLFEETVYQ